MQTDIDIQIDVGRHEQVNKYICTNVVLVNVVCMCDNGHSVNNCCIRLNSYL